MRKIVNGAIAIAVLIFILWVKFRIFGRF